MITTKIHSSTTRVHGTRGRFTSLAAAGLLGALALGACGGSEAAVADSTAAGSAAQPVVLGPQDVAEARVQPITAGVTLTGSLQPAQSVTLTAQVAGTATGVRVDRGTAVSRGQTLATIEAAGVRSQAAGARASVAAAEAQLALARRQLEAARRLHEAGATSAIEYETAQANYEAVEAQLAAARAQAAGAGEAASRTVVTAPMAGVVSQRFVESGQPVSVGDRLFTVVDASTLELSAQVPVDAAAGVRVGQPVTFSLAADPSRELRGRVDRVDPVADPATRQVGVYARLANPGGRIIAGQFATGRVVGERVEGAVVVPAAAVRQEGSESYVLAIENGRIARRTVTTGATDEAAGIVEIQSGLRAGEQVLATPAATLAVGTPVTVANDAAGVRAPDTAPAAAAPAATTKDSAAAPASAPPREKQ
ncbi:MAG TPA: efflux RND transporter periplasmic adaptor subunit [Gemmatimonadaceae bacterium]|nr:efflux RND transporter periplasmic adaptor subunit [Gemmatimonadaceae bacterium]